MSDECLTNYRKVSLRKLHVAYGRRREVNTEESIFVFILCYVICFVSTDYKSGMNKDRIHARTLF